MANSSYCLEWEKYNDTYNKNQQGTTKWDPTTYNAKKHKDSQRLIFESKQRPKKSSQSVVHRPVTSNNNSNLTSSSSSSSINTTQSKTSALPVSSGIKKGLPTNQTLRIEPIMKSIIISIGSQYTHQILNIITLRKLSINNNNTLKQFTLPTAISFEKAITHSVIRESQTYISNLMSKAQYQIYCSSSNPTTRKAFQSSLIKNVLEGFMTILDNVSIAILLPNYSPLLNTIPSNKLLSTTNCTYEFIIFIYNP